MTKYSTGESLVSSLCDAGYYLFPVVDRGQNAKRPRKQDWQQDSTNDVEIARQMIRTTNALGIDCGKSGVYVVDIDVKATDGYKALGDDYQRLLDAGPMHVKTASGGAHLYFRQVEGEHLRNTSGAGKRRVAEGVDTRGAGGLTVAPGSTLDEGQRVYELVGPLIAVQELPVVPDWVLARVRASAAERVAHSVHLDYTPGSPGAQELVRSMVIELETMPPGKTEAGGSGRREELRKKAMRLALYGLLTNETAARLITASMRAGLDYDRAVKAVQGGIENAQRIKR